MIFGQGKVREFHFGLRVGTQLKWAFIIYFEYTSCEKKKFFYSFLHVCGYLLLWPDDNHFNL